MPTYVTLTPMEHPFIYLFFVLNVATPLFSAWVAVHFYRESRQKFWILIAVIFVLMPLAEVTAPVLRGLWPLPSALEFPPVDVTPPAPPATTTTLSDTFSRMVVERRIVTTSPRVENYLLALALGYGYLKSRRREGAAPLR